METKIKTAIEIIKQLSDFKKEHSDIFKEMKEMQNTIKELKNEILSEMTDDQDEVSYNGFVFKRKTTKGMQHNMETLHEVLDGDGTVDDYVARVCYNREFITHKRQKT